MVIGGQAVLRYGEPRLTKDIDMTLGLWPQQLDKVLEFIEGMDLALLVDIAFIEQTLVIPVQDQETGLRVDFMLGFTPYEQEALRRAQSVLMESTPVRFATLEDVIIHKCIAGRPRDLEDIKSILRKNPSADTAYIHDWLKQYESLTGEPLVLRFNTLLDE